MNKYRLLQIQAKDKLYENIASDFKQSLEYYKRYSDNLEKIIGENKNKELEELKKKYNYERLQNENSQLKINRQKMYISFSILLLILSLLALYFYKRFTDNKRLALERENQIIETEKKIYQLMDMSNSYNSKEKSFRNLLLHHFDILKKVALLKQYLNKEDRSHRLVKKFNEIVYGQESLKWDMFYQDMNNIYNGLFDRLKDHYPELKEDEFRVCCLTYAGFSCSEIGIIMNSSIHTIEMKRTDIRKKLGIETRGDIKTYLKAMVGS